MNFSPIKVRFLSNTNPWRGKYYSRGIVESLSLCTPHLLSNETRGALKLLEEWVVLLILPASPTHPILFSLGLGSFWVVLFSLPLDLFVFWLDEG